MSQQGIQPLAIACWDLAWLLRRRSLHDPFFSLERVLDETRERGFNAIRLDPCPHLLATPENSVHMDRCELLPRRGDSVEVHIRQQLRHLLQSAHERGFQFWLSSHFINDSRARRSFVRRPTDFVAVWSETLGLLEQWGYLDNVAAVDFCYQFPSLPAAHGLARRVFRRSPERPLPQHWPAQALDRLEDYLLEVPRGLKALFPRIPVGLSTNASLSEQFRQLDTSELDFLDFSLWLDDDPRYRLASGDAVPKPGLVNRLTRPMKHLLLDVGGSHWQQRMATQMQQRLAFTRLRRLQPVLGEGFVDASATLSHLPTGWAELHEMMVVDAVTQGVQALTPSSLAGPQTPWLWQEQDYLAHLNHMILANSDVAQNVPNS